jgi:AcrR family transcriptional regulator
MTRKKATHGRRTRTAQRRRGRRVTPLQHGKGREALIEAAVHAVAREGTDGFSYRAVARQAGVAHGLVHYHFGSHDALLVEAYKWAVARVIERMRALPVASWVEAYSHSLTHLAREDGDLYIILNTLLLDACRDERKRALVEPVFAEVTRAVQDALEAAQMPARPALARMVAAALIGLSLQHQALGKTRQTREALAELGHILAPLRPVSGPPR